LSLLDQRLVDIVNGGSTPVGFGLNSEALVNGDLSPGYFATRFTQPAPTSTWTVPVGANSTQFNDFELKYLRYNRVSNLISTRSDVYAVYVVVQAWTWNGNISQATDTRLVGERRRAFIVDRSGITANNSLISDLRIIPIESE
jgi:hypothetical protein